MRRTLSKAKGALDKKLALVDSVSEIARRSKVSSDRAIALLHSGREKEALGLLREARGGIAILASALRREPSAYYASFQIPLAFQEYAEAQFLLCALKGRDFPDLPGMPAEPFILGLADAAGELNRAFLEARIRGDRDAAARYLSKAREIADAFADLDYPDFMIPSFRHKKDFVRSVLSGMLSIEARGGNRDG